MEATDFNGPEKATNVSVSKRQKTTSRNGQTSYSDLEAAAVKGHYCGLTLKQQEK
jgi:hypothetical protein